jgi:hypothetical protein
VSRPLADNPKVARRPAWQRMGVWKWPSLVLIALCLVITPLYIQRITAERDLGVQVAAAGGACQAQVFIRRLEKEWLIQPRIAPDCARRAEQVSLMLNGKTQSLDGPVYRWRVRVDASDAAAKRRGTLEIRFADGQVAAIDFAFAKE